jgi:hypothetical protein
VVIRGHQVRPYGPGVSEHTSRGDAHGCWEIRLQGHLHPRWSAWFDGLAVSNEPNGTALIRGEVVDQAALHGLLRKLADLGLPLLSVTHIGPEGADTRTTAIDVPPQPRRRS